MAGTPKLIVLSEQLRGQTFELTEDEYTVGRAEECDICIPDPTMSSHHCTLLKDEEDNGYILKDNDSTNGTRVNGVRIDDQRLNNSDILQIGGVEVLYDSHEKFVTSVLSTQTKINLEDTAGDLTVSEMSNFSPFGSRLSASLAPSSKSKWVMWTAYGVIALLSTAVLVVLILLLFGVVGSG